MSELLDTELIEELQELMEDDFGTLLETFLTESRIQLQAITQQARTSDQDGLRRAAHSLKGSAANLGATSLTSLCEQLEHEARQQQPAGVPENIALIERELQLVCEEFERLLRSL